MEREIRDNWDWFVGKSGCVIRYSVRLAKTFNCPVSTPGLGHRSWPVEPGYLGQNFWVKVTYQSHRDEIYGKRA